MSLVLLSRLFLLILHKFFKLLLSLWSNSITFIDWISLGSPSGMKFNGRPHLYIHPKSQVNIGKNLILTSNSSFNSIGVFSPALIKVFPRGSLIIGDNVGMSGVHISCSTMIEIGDNVLIGADVLITDNDAHPIHPDERLDPTKIGKKPITIESDVFIGARSIILKGAHICKGSVIGAGSVISGVVPPYTITAGNPAKFINSIEIRDF